MWVELILFVLLALLVIYYFHGFGLLGKNEKNIQARGSDTKETQKHGDEISAKTDDQSSHSEDISTMIENQSSHREEILTKTDEQSSHSEDISAKTEDHSSHSEDISNKTDDQSSSDESDSKEHNYKTDCMDTAHDEFTDDKSRCCGEKIDPEQNIFREFVDENILNEYMEQKGVLRGLMKYIKENIDKWKKRKLNIAVIGNSGTGKSSLINALRGLKPSDKKAAPVGVTETTTERKEYEFPNHENTVLWDLPGVGTQQFRRKEYLEEFNIRDFDAFIIVSASRFTENEIWLAEEILKQIKFIFFVRTKVDIDLMNDKRDHPETFDAKRCLQGMRKEIRKNFDKVNIPMPKAGIFLVSSVERDTHDLQDMFEKLRDHLNSKGVSVQKLLQTYIEQVIKKESIARKASFIVQKCASTLIPLILVVNFFANDIINKLSADMYCTCKEAFCIDEKTLQEVSEEIDISVKDLKERQLKFFKNIEKKKSIFFRPNLDIFPFSLIPCFQGHHFFKTKLHTVCDTLAEDEVTLIELRLSRLVEQLTPL